MLSFNLSSSSEHSYYYYFLTTNFYACRENFKVKDNTIGDTKK